MGEWSAYIYMHKQKWFVTARMFYQTKGRRPNRTNDMRRRLAAPSFTLRGDPVSYHK